MTSVCLCGNLQTIGTGTIIDGKGGLFEKSGIIIKDGKVDKITADIPKPDVTASDLFIMPGFVAGYFQWKSEEYDDAALVYDHTSPRIKEIRSEGFTSLLFAPSAKAGKGTLWRPVPGISPFVKEKSYFCLNVRASTDFKKQFAEYFEKYADAIAKKQTPDEPWFKALNGEIPTVAAFSSPAEIQHFFEIVKANKSKINLVCICSASCAEAADYLKKAAVKCTLLASPSNTSETGTRNQINAVIEFKKSGLIVGIAPTNTQEILEFTERITQLTRYGLREEEIISMCTTIPAAALGISGTIEPGKEANFIVFEGNPFRGASRTKAVVIDGKVYANY